jgi:hypothetical protein
MLLNDNVEEPYNKFPPDGPVAMISKSVVKARLSSKFMEMTNNRENVEPQDYQEQGSHKKSQAKSSKKVSENDLDLLKDQIAKLKDEIRVKMS